MKSGNNQIVQEPIVEIPSSIDESEIKSKIKIKYLKDTSYDLFNEIFSEMEFENLEGEKVQINDYQDFHNFQLELNSKYNADIKFFDYKNRLNVNTIKEIPYKATRLRAISQNDDSVIISPNGHFVQTKKQINKSTSTLEHYHTIIGNSLILKGEYYFEIKILEIGNNTDMYFGIVSQNSQLLNNDKYKNFPLCAFDDCYGFDLNDTFNTLHENRNHRNKKIISVGTIISIKVNLNKNKISIFIDGKKVVNNTINIKDETLGYYPAFSLSNGKEIQVKFGGIYNLFVYFETAYQIDAKPICQYNNLENIVSCYLKIVDNYLIKIINHNQISYTDSIKYFNPLIQFFANIAFNDEYIVKNYILKFMYKDYIHGKDINKHFDERFNFFYLIINNIEKSKQQESILFLLDCLSEDIKLDSYIFDSNEKMKNVCLSIRLYNYFLKKNLFKEILFPEEQMDRLVYKKIKYQLFIIFQSLTICGNNNLREIDFENAMKITKEKISKFIINNNFIEYYSELIETLLELEQDIPKSIDDKIDKLIMKLNYENKDSENNIEQNEGIECKFLYRKIFLDLINDIFENISNKNIYNVISTIFLPLLNLFNIYYKKESSLKYTKGNILAYLPFLRNDMIYLMCKSSKFLVNLDIVDKNNINNTLKDITGLDFLNKELDQKNLNISSTLIGLIINLSAFFEKEIFDFDLYLQNRDYQHILKIWKTNSKEFKINNYTENMKKLIYLYNENNINVLKLTLNNLIPYFYELLNNNCYLFLPYKIMNLLKFFIKFISYHYFIYRDDKIIKNKNTTKLIQLYVSLNFKLLYSNITTNDFFLMYLII